MISSEDIQKAIDRFVEETGTDIFFSIAAAKFGTRGQARRALCSFVAQQINDKLEKK